MTGIFDTVIDPAAQALARRESEILIALRELVEREQPEEKRRVDELLQGLDELFTVVIVGEFNAGKSSLINALFGSPLRKEGPVPVDDRISVLKWGEEPRTRERSDFVLEQYYPVEFLRTITLVDTPGTNSIVQRHQEITRDFIPRADLVLFVTSIDRPLSESERIFLEYIREWGKKIVFVLTKIDTKTPQEIDEVVTWLATNLRSLLRIEPVIYPVAAKQALAAKSGENSPREWTASRFEPLEDYLFKVLSEKERLRLKLSAPIETALSLIRKLTTMIEARREVLRADMERIQKITEHLDLAEREMRGNFSQFVTRLDNLMLELERRGIDFLERTIRIGNILLLRDSARFREEFQRQVFFDFEGSVDRTIQDSVDWLVRENMKLWRDTVEAFERRKDAGLSQEVIGRTGREFAYNRDEIYSRIKQEAERRIGSYDVGVESRRLIDSAMQAVFQTFGLGAGALGLGYLVSTVFTSAAVDVTGLTAATMMLVTSFLILPYKRSKAKTDFRLRIDELRSQVRDAVGRESTNEIDRMMSTLRDAFEPYRRFYTTESGKLDGYSSKLSSIQEEADEVVTEIAKL